MEIKVTLPPEITQGATARGNEYGRTLEAFLQALLKAQVLGYACLGGQFQFRLNDGTYEMYWLDADSTNRREGEPWPEYVRRSCVFQRIAFPPMGLADVLTGLYLMLFAVGTGAPDHQLA